MAETNAKNQIGPVKSADRVLDILELLAEKPAGVAYSDMAAALGIPKSSLFPLLRNLTSRGYITQREPAGPYRLGKQVQHLAAKLEAPPLLSLIAPFIESASRELNETSAFYLRHKDQARVGFAVEGAQPLRFTLSVGDEAPLYACSAGRAMLSATRPDHLDAYLKYIRPEPFTPNSKVDPADIRQTIETTASSGFACDVEEFAVGVASIARAVCYAGAPAGAVGFAIPSVRFNEAYKLRVCRVLRATTTAIEAAMNEAGYKGWLE